MRIADEDTLAARVTALRALLREQALDALAVTNLHNIAYLTGFFASAAALIVTKDEVVLIGDARYAEALSARSRACPFIRAVEIPAGLSYDELMADLLAPMAGLRVGLEASHLSLRRYRYLLRRLGGGRWTDALIETDGVVEQLRARKDPWEIGRLRDGGERLSSVAKRILPNVLAGRTEIEVAADIEAALRAAGFERPAFDTIVASGPNAARPHARAAQRQIEEGDLVVVDFGGVLDGYCTDLTRTVTAGRPGPRERQLIAQVVEAQAAAFETIRAGSPPEAVDRAARDTLARAGLAAQFTHGTGHGLGLEVHEAPRVSRGRPNHAEPLLADGMVLTLEPGVYFPGWGGVRIEDDVLVTAGGAEWLTDVPRTLP